MCVCVCVCGVAENQKESTAPLQHLLSIAHEINKELSDSEFAEEMDRRDSLQSFKDQFLFPPLDPDNPGSSPVIYLCGNSLGLQPKRTSSYVMYELKEWAKRGVEAHHVHTRTIEGRTATDAPQPWLTTDENVHARAAKLVGAKPIEVAIMNGLTTNLHFMMIPFYQPTPQRHKILIEGKSFPSDRVRSPRFLDEISLPYVVRDVASLVASLLQLETACALSLLIILSPSVCVCDVNEIVRC